jgi:hypothetical protein
MSVNLGMIGADPAHIIPKFTREYQGIFRKTKLLFFVRLVGKSKDP